MKIKYAHFLIKEKKIINNQGFTLIELLVVVIIVGVLAAVALPNLLSQVGKSREAEAKHNLGVMARAQQAYHFENQVFANSLNLLTANATFSQEYYNYPNADTANSLVLKQRAVSINSDLNRTRDYAIGIYFNAGTYQFIFCQAQEVGQVVEAPNIAGDACTNSGVVIN